MDNKDRMWNPQQFSPSQTEPYNSTGPVYQTMKYPPPPLPQPHHFQNQYFSYPSIHHPPPPFLPPSVPPPSQFFQFPPPSQFYSAPDSVESDIAQLGTEDRWWVANWLAQRNIHVSPKKTPSSNSIKLMDVRDLFLNCSSAIKKLRELHCELSTLSSCADEAHWNSLLVEVIKKKAELASLLNTVRSLDLTAIRAKLSKRAKKRKRLRRKRVKVRALKQAEQARRKMLHQRADAWLAEMRLTVEREHREQELRREADAVLGEVTRKQSEAKRQISLLDALIKLREVRAQRTAMHSNDQDVGRDHSAKKFATVIERLRKLWKAQLKEYAGEERGLRVMLHESAVQKNDARCQWVKSTIDQWHRTIFGESACNMPVKQDTTELITVRAEWDKYVVRFRANAAMASTIPIGWVLPQEPSSDLWRPYCDAYNKVD